MLKIEWCIKYSKDNGLCEECELGYLPSIQGVCIHELLAFFQRNQNFEEKVNSVASSNEGVNAVEPITNLKSALTK